jgi:Ty3 transposon capsid-like protein
LRTDQKNGARQQTRTISWPWHHDAFGFLDILFEHLFGGDQYRSNSVGCSASTYLIESAAVWYEHRVHDLQTADILDTWDAFCQDLINTFQPTSAHAMARDKLHNLRPTNTVQHFNCDFLKTITLVRGMTDHEKVDKYTDGLNPHLKCEVLMENCTTLSHAMQVASKGELVFTRTNREMPKDVYNRAYNHSYSHNNFHQYPAHTGYQDTAVAMEVNNLSNGFYKDSYNGYRDNYGTCQGQQHVNNKHPYSTGSGNPPAETPTNRI